MRRLLSRLERRPALSLGAGAVLFVAYVVGLARIPTPPGEFDYFYAQPTSRLFSPLLGFTPEQLTAHLVMLGLGLPALLLLTVGVMGLAARRERLAGLLGRLVEARGRRVALVASVVGLGLLAVALLGVLGGRAIVDDELAYFWQAQLLGQGRLAVPCPPGALLGEKFTVVSQLGCTAKYLPGEALVQVPGTWVGVGALMHLPLAALTLLFVFLAFRRLSGERVAGWTTALVALSPMFVAASATGQSQSTALFAVALAALGWSWVRRDDVRPGDLRPGDLRRAAPVGTGVLSLAGAGVLSLAFGFGMLVRPQTLLPVAAVLGPAALWTLLRRRRWAAAAVLVLGSAAGAALLLAYDHLVTGSALTLPWDLFQPRELYGFGAVVEADPGVVHTPADGLANLMVVLFRLNHWWLGWPVSFVLLVVWLRVGRPLEGARIWLWVGLAVIVFQLGYFSTGISDVGPIYHFELLLPLALLGGGAIVAAARARPQALAALLAVHFLLGAPVFAGYHGARLHRLTRAIHGPFEDRLPELETPALVLYERGCADKYARGWLSTPVGRRTRLDTDPVVYFPRPEPRDLAWWRARYADRRCYYWRFDPAARAHELLDCDEAASLLSRPALLGPCFRPKGDGGR